MLSMKDKGIEEVRSVKRRAARSLALGRISKDSYDKIADKCDELEAIIINMDEQDERRMSF